MARAQHVLLLRRCSSLLLRKTLNPFSSSTNAASRQRFSYSSGGGDGDGISGLRDRIVLLTEKAPSGVIPDATAEWEKEREELRSAVATLADALLAAPASDSGSDSDHFASDSASASAAVLLLDSRSAADLLRRSPDGFASVELLSRLKPRPFLALEVFNWRRKQAESGIPMLPEEYAKAIAIAGRAKNVDLAADLFAEALASRIQREACLYNSLMAAYMYNGNTKKAVAVFEDLKRDPLCKPTIVTYNILLSVFGRSMLVDHMEAVLRSIDESGLPRTLTTYNTVIAAYVTAWMWDRMEAAFQVMEEGPVKPDVSTHLLILRGYAHSGNLEKMEKTYELVREQVNDRELPLILAMICAYCKSSDPDRVQKVEALMKFIPEDEYRPWLNVLLIRLYAQEGLVEAMERYILEALQRSTMITTAGVMRSIISSYFRCNAVDRLAGFVRQAEYAGWRLCRSLYHCKMVMYGQQHRLEEMHGVLDEMENYRLDPTKKTFLIMYMAYSKTGRRSEAETIIGMMWKNGFCSPEDASFPNMA